MKPSQLLSLNLPIRLTKMRYDRREINSLWREVKMAKQEAKEWYKSKTLWVGVLEIVGGVIMTVSGQIEAGIPLTLFGVVQVVLRTVTKSELMS